MTLLVSFVLPFAVNAQTQFNDSPFKDSAGAEIYVNELASLVAGADKIFQGPRNFDIVMNAHWEGMKEVFNTSASVVEMKQRFQANQQSFDMLRAELDLAIEFTNQISENSVYGDTQAVASEARRVLMEYRRSADILQGAFNDFDPKTINTVWVRLETDMNGFTNYWDDFGTQIVANLMAAFDDNTKFERAEQVGCPYAYGSYNYMMNCVEAGELASSGSE